MNYPGSINKSYKKLTTHANRGMDLESLINLSNEYYLNEDIAVIYKKPTPIQIVATKIINDNKLITKAFFKEPSTLDYNGIYKGKYLDFDAKVTKSKTSFPLSNIHNHQLEHMKNIIKHGGISFLIIAINDDVFYLDGHDIINFINNNDRKSIPYEYIYNKGYKVERKINPRLDYISIVESIYFGGENNE